MTRAAGQLSARERFEEKCLEWAIWAIETVSMAAMHIGSGGMLQISLCACAWLYQFRPWVATFDRLLRWYERDHCRASFERCFGGD